MYLFKRGCGSFGQHYSSSGTGEKHTFIMYIAHIDRIGLFIDWYVNYRIGMLFMGKQVVFRPRWLYWGQFCNAWGQQCLLPFPPNCHITNSKSKKVKEQEKTRRFIVNFLSLIVIFIDVSGREPESLGGKVEHPGGIPPPPPPAPLDEWRVHSLSLSNFKIASKLVSSTFLGLLSCPTLLLNCTRLHKRDLANPKSPGMIFILFFVEILDHTLVHLVYFDVYG